mmetsp:Transcript_28961/g.81555  ORF Transcript_28961/g.81555 Transcript_28961/m.81555 type:complete len:472 (-) Transcript_28961:82-1497(-)
MACEEWPQWELPPATEVHIVERAEQLQAVERALTAAAQAGGVCGMDAEWPPHAPTAAKGRSKVAAATLIQLAFEWLGNSKVFLLDLMSLPMASAAETFAAVLAKPNLLKVGHGLKGDIRAIARAIWASAQSSQYGQACSYGAAACDRGAMSVEQAAEASPAEACRSRELPDPQPCFDLASWHQFFGLSLANICKGSLQRLLDKTEQCSAWGSRPLSQAQVEYAAKDAAVCVAVFKRLWEAEGQPALDQDSSVHSATVKAHLLKLNQKSEEALVVKARGPRNAPKSHTRDGGGRLQGTPSWPTSSPASHMRFACDETLEGLARTMRLCGIDTASPRLGCPASMDSQQWLLLQAGAGRLILTADRALFRKLAGYPTYLVAAQGKQRQLQEVASAFGIEMDDDDLLSRCCKCNGEFRLLSSAEAAARVMVEIVARFPDREYWECTGCGHHFWQGTQYERALMVVQNMVGSLSVQ